MSLWILLLIFVLIIVNALYVAAEFALVGSRVTRVEHLAGQGSRLAAAVLPVVRDTARLDRHIAACQIGITLSSLVLGALGQATVAVALGGWLIAFAGLQPAGAYALSATLTLIVLTSTQVVLGELLPKTVALQFPVRTAMYTYLPLRWSVALLSPFINLLNGSGAAVLRLFGVSGEASHRHVHSPEEIDLLIRESRQGGVLEGRESERLRDALQLGQLRVAQLMVPARQIEAVDLNAPAHEVLAKVSASPYTRLVAHAGGLEEIRGYLHAKDVAAAVAAGHETACVSELVRPLLALPSALTIDRALGQLRNQRARIALVVDEYGDLEGLISLQDIIRELIGELSDEFKGKSRLTPEALADGRWRLPGRLPLIDVVDWVRPAERNAWASAQARTLGGWVLERLDAIPEGPCCLRVGGLELEVEEVSGMAIQTVLVRVHGTDAGASHA